MPISSKLEKDLRFSGDRKHHVGVAPFPFSASKGDTWTELDANNNYLQKWFWNGNYWLSVALYSYSYTNQAATSVATLNSTFPVKLNYNLFVVQLFATLFSNLNATSTSCWSWNLRRATASGSSTILSSANTAGQAINTWATYSNPINIHIDIVNTQTINMRISESPTGGSASRLGTVGFEYRLARI